MYTRRNFPFSEALKWTRRDIYKFLLISILPVALYSLLHFKWLHLPWLPIALVGTAVAFLVSFKNNASYGRLWEARQIWGGIVNESRTFALMVNDYISNEHAVRKRSEEELQAIRKELIHRHVAWMTAHRYALRQSKPWESISFSRSNQEYTAANASIAEWKTPFEEAVAPYLSAADLAGIGPKKNKAAQILAIQSRRLRELKEEGLIWEFSFLEMENQLKDFFTLQGKNERIKNFPYPRQFATMNFYFVWIFIILLPFGIMAEFEGIGIELLGRIDQSVGGIWRQIYRVVAENFVWLSVPFSLIVAWVFYVMERIGEASENPFEGLVNDVPITSMSRGIEIDIREMIGENPADIPPPIEAVKHVLT